MTDHQAALEEIYDGARYAMDGHLSAGTPVRAGFCRWCDAPPPDEDHDHDVACPAAKAGYALGKAGYRDGSWTRIADRLAGG